MNEKFFLNTVLEHVSHTRNKERKIIRHGDLKQNSWLGRIIAPQNQP